MNAWKCQLQSTDTMHEGNVQLVSMSFRRRLRLTITRQMDPRLKRFIKGNLKRLRRRPFGGIRAARTIPGLNSAPPIPVLKSGDMVRIRSLKEIRATLGPDGRLKGCRFMPEMEQHCGSVQRVFKPVERFLNEFDYTIREANGLVLLENLFCQGVAESGRCDRSCFYFWRVEWLEEFKSGLS